MEVVSIDLDAADLRCAICHDPLYNPITTACGHQFCKGCLLRWLDQPRAAHGCPSCREAFPHGFDASFVRLCKPDRLLDDILRRTYYVACPHGCGAAVHPSHQAEHAAVCEEAPVACENASHGCTDEVRRCDMADHLLECRHYPCAAECLGCRHTAGITEVSAHEQGCALRLVKDYVDSAVRAATTLPVFRGSIGDVRLNPLFTQGGTTVLDLRPRAPGPERSNMRTLAELAEQLDRGRERE